MQRLGAQYFVIIITLMLGVSCTRSATDCSKPENESESVKTKKCTSDATNRSMTSAIDGSSSGTGDGSQIILPPPASVDDGDYYHSLTQTPTITWSAVEEAVDYEVAVGISAGATDVMDWTSTNNQTSFYADGLNLNPYGRYFASIRAVSEDKSKGLKSEGDGWINFICPDDWIMVPGSITAGLGGGVYVNGTRTRHDGSTREISDFCVMKYEAKMDVDGTIAPSGNVSPTVVDLRTSADAVEVVGGIVKTKPGGLVVKPVSSAIGKPWTNVERTASSHKIGAEDLCASLGEHFYLINNNQWQTIARSIESNANNMVGGVVNIGHSDSTPPQSCDGDVANVGADCATADASTPHLQKRTHLLANGNEIWDFSGNVEEVLIDDVGAGMNIDPVPDLRTKWNLEYTDSSCGAGSDPCFSSTNRSMFGPEGVTLTSTEGIGKFFGSIAAEFGGAIIRSGFYNNGSSNGLYFANLAYDSAQRTSDMGFRCVWAP